MNSITEFAPPKQRSLADILKAAEHPNPTPTEKQIMSDFEEELADNLRRLRDQPLKHIAQQIYHLRYGLMIQLAEEVGALLDKAEPNEAQTPPESVAKAIYTWAEQLVTAPKEPEE